MTWVRIFARTRSDAGGSIARSPRYPGARKAARLSLDRIRTVFFA
jgi:hypothetical protein